MTSAIRAALVQMEHGDTLDANLRRARSMLAGAVAGGAQLAVLPEYFFATFREPPTEPAALRVRALLAEASRDLGLAVAANVIEPRSGALRNVGVVYERGAPVLEQSKIHPMPREAASGIVGGDGLGVGTVLGEPAGMLVCADILYPEAARILAIQGARLLLNPVMSPWRESDNARAARDAIFIARAYDSGAFVLKAGGFRRPRDGFGIAGRSLVAAPWGIVAHYGDDMAEEILFATLDLERLEEFRKHQASFPARRPEAYGGLL